MKIISMIIKDFKIAISDRTAILLLIVMPIVLMSILGMSLTLSFEDFSSMEKIKIGIVKEYDLQEEKDELIDIILKNTDSVPEELDFGDFNLEEVFFKDFMGNDELEKIIQYEILDREKATQLLRDKEITAMVILPKGFIKDTMINFGTSFRNVVEIRVIGRSDKNIGTTIVEEVMRGFSDIMNYNIAAKNSFTRLYERLQIEGDISLHIEAISEKINDILKTQRPELKYEELNNRPPMNSRAYYAFAMTAMFVLFSAGYGGKLLLEEKDMKTYDRMSASGVEQWSIVIGKTATIFLVVLVQSVISFLFSSSFLRVEWGNTINVLMIFLTSSLAIAGLGILISALVYKSGNYNLENVFTSFIIQVMSILGGNMLPIEVLPGIVRTLSNFVPNGLLLKALMKNYYGYGFNEFSQYLLGMIAFGITFMILATIILMRGRRGNHVKYTITEGNEA